mmetsp:Transcript_4796/g.12308  ORF Transcript_4796/g.12308 Transcript_4796/m.12308 type:complete len:232 (-) Transcript_4796:15-710(-)
MFVPAEQDRHRRLERLGERRREITVLLDALVRQRDQAVGRTARLGGGRPDGVRGALELKHVGHVGGRVDVAVWRHKAAEEHQTLPDGQRGRLWEKVKLGVDDVGVEHFAAARPQLVCQLRDPNVKLVVAQAAVVKPHRVDRLRHRRSSVQRGIDAWRQEVAVQNGDHRAALRRSGLGLRNGRGEAREDVQRIHIVHRQHAQERALCASSPRGEAVVHGTASSHRPASSGLA